MICKVAQVMAAGSARATTPRRVAGSGAAAKATARARARGVRRANEVVDEVDLGAGHEFERDRVDQHRDLPSFDDEVIRRPLAVDVESVLEARAAAALDADAQHRPGRFPLQDLADPARCPFGDGDGIGHDARMMLA
jgi:hypothetical protein